MLGIHAGQGAEHDLGARFVACFVQAADDAGLPDDPELRAGLRAYMEWAVGEVLSYSPSDARMAAGLPVPRWGWDGLESSVSRPGRPDYQPPALGDHLKRLFRKADSTGQNEPQSTRGAVERDP
jgi:hypothetical protein